MFKKIPTPITGLALGLASLGNLPIFSGSALRNIFGFLAAVLIVLFLGKLATHPMMVKEDFENPAIASVTPTFSMCLMILATYLKPFTYGGAFWLWIVAIIIHLFLTLAFTLKHLKDFDIKKVFPSYFVVYFGIACAAVVAPSFAMETLGKYVFFFALACFLPIIPLVVYRTFVIKEVPEPAKPTLAIYSAPISLALAGYLNSFSDKNVFVIGFLACLGFLMLLFVMSNMPRLLSLKFYPSYASFTFPFVITATAVGGAIDYYIQLGINLTYLIPIARLLDFWAVAMVMYVLIRYLLYIVLDKEILWVRLGSESEETN